MNKEEIRAFFDRLAPGWDQGMVTDERKLAYILDAAGVTAGTSVLDVACGTGVLFPFYLARGVSRVTAVDISPEMARIAALKCGDPRVDVLCGDMETIPVGERCDLCVIYNALPHFEDPARLMKRLALWVKPGGRLTVAHGMSLEALASHHSGSAAGVSCRMLTTEELAAAMAPWFRADRQISDEEKYLVSALRTEEN